MNGIYPDYVGPTIEYRKVSLFPDWVGVLGGLLVPPAGWLGGVIVLPNPYATAIVGAALAGIAQLAKTAATIWPSSQGVIARLSTLGGVDTSSVPAADPVNSERGAIPVAKPGIGIVTKESGHE